LECHKQTLLSWSYSCEIGSRRGSMSSKQDSEEGKTSRGDGRMLAIGQ
jgi:hypothetical protein